MAFLLPRLFNRPAGLRGPARGRVSAERAVLLFESETLIDASTGAAEYLPPAPLPGMAEAASDLQRLVGALDESFPGIGEMIDDVAPGERRRLEGAFGESRAELSRWCNRLRIAIIHDRGETMPPPPAMAAAMEELEVLRSIGDAAPLPIWKVDSAGRICWANSAYLSLCETMRPVEEEGGRDWPPPLLFESLGAPPQEDDPVTHRRELMLPGTARPQCFDITLVRRGGEVLAYAIDVTETEVATQARAEFVQTLSKTFAQISIGLAIFDRQRRLVMFNPAFTDLCDLSVSYLSAKPTLPALLDRLRDKRLLPEPKNYRTWRKRLMDVESAAKEGTFGETWVLPSGQTIRVTGRPHPDGALAFLFEDITGEVALTRHFREEMDLAQAVLDRSEEAIAVFTTGGRLSMANEAYEDMWGATESRLSDLVLSGEMERWRQAAPSRVWDRLRRTAESRGSRISWGGLVKRRDGARLHLRVEPLPAGALMVGFQPTQAIAAAPPRAKVAAPPRQPALLSLEPPTRDRA
ncbi:PAS-domain containing protein [Pseudoroseicyclus tamaricis]|uniref:PAS domain-containing protein n=1 Tax=Pseudoroseicyclus tamaricis TaxID=2705421 RepID=A0A6B2JXS2_9RHOB|nr:PAS-domain containing protein [Pseudoroseicyclus tamaricis]NDV02655.1 PAS domain-containing protein [Pseudoroseicyclus tamaricis]